MKSFIIRYGSFVLEPVYYVSVFLGLLKSPWFFLSYIFVAFVFYVNWFDDDDLIAVCLACGFKVEPATCGFCSKCGGVLQVEWKHDPWL